MYGQQRPNNGLGLGALNAMGPSLTPLQGVYSQVPNQNQVPVPMPTREQVLSYSSSWYQFYDLVRRFQAVVNTNMVVQILAVKTADVAKERFEQWSVVKLGIYVVIKSICLMLGFINTPGFALMRLPTATIGFFVAVFFVHLNWYCVVKRQGGCCGNRGYLAWASYLAVEPLLLWLLFGRYYGGWLKLGLYVPNFFMVAACLALYRAPPETQVRSALSQVGDAVNNFATTAKAAVVPCCPWLTQYCNPQPQTVQE